jgi:uncharacterized protein (TIGR03067 family)
VAVSGEADGQPLPAESVTAAQRVARGGVTTVTIGGQVFRTTRYTVDPATAPEAIGYVMTDGLTEGKTQLRVYEQGGGTVTFCFAAPDQARPTDFKGGRGRVVSVWKRTAR